MKNIVILGAGFGGLQAAFRLGRALQKNKLVDRYAVTLVDRNSYHTFTPRLYAAVAAAEDRSSSATFNLRELLAGLPVAVKEDTVTAIDLVGRNVRLTGEELHFEYLVLALGAETHYPAATGLAEHALPFKTFNDALKVREALTRLPERLAAKKHACGAAPHVVVCGGGATGIGLAAEIAAHRKEDAAAPMHVTVIEAGPAILPALHPALGEKARCRLKQLGVSVLTHERIAKVFPSFLFLERGEKIHYDLCIWTGGVKPSPLTAPLSLKKGTQGHLEVPPDMAAVEHVYVIGDLASLYDTRTKAMVSGTARPAIMEGRTAAANIMERIKVAEGITAVPKQRTYAPRFLPTVVSLGNTHAAANVGPLVFTGFPARAMKKMVTLHYLLSIMPPTKALRAWCNG